MRRPFIRQHNTPPSPLREYAFCDRCGRRRSRLYLVKQDGNLVCKDLCYDDKPYPKERLRQPVIPEE